jgi:hypothetical protein
MSTLLKHHLQNLSRREFLKLTGSSLFSVSWLPFAGESDRINEFPSADDASLGRILSDRVLVYNQPSLSAKILKAFPRDQILPITRITLGDREPSYNRLWYELNNEGYVHSGAVQPVKINHNPAIDRLTQSNLLAEVTVPFTDTIWNLRLPDSHAYRLYYSTVHWITRIDTDEKGKSWYRLFDDKWNLYFFADPTHLKVINPQDLEPISSQVPSSEKRLEIRLVNQVVIAYEYNKPVFMTRTATGARFIDGDYTTPSGKFMTNRKRPSRHMAAGDRAAPNSYDLPGIPWVCYLTESGISFHGTYWHNDYGKPRSHGCINLSPAAAKWVYRWTLPQVPFQEPFFDDDTGTTVNVME